ncbi:hypothetical protein GCM10011514_00400 [Emticicia aquatilis]|uniref:Heparinase n=1 Tax=Emticicia aquatilis TaxID=1537369 RepID=A0A917DIE3_9BACT|nr:hypothetical protein [Emticicia aquatilis]GGD40225.1 hypothetical protein GCM10011514_00400 [Emticicia aquatilis]
MKNTILFLSFLLLNTFLVEANDDIYSKKFTYQTLSPYQKHLFEEFLADEIPTGAKIEDVLTDNTSLRSKTRLAEALLFRNAAEDKEKAIVILRWILKNQYQDENTKIYGIWKTSINNDKFDQNWREFIGCDLIIIRNKFRHLLPENIIKDIETGIIHAAKGAFKRNVAPDYTNISIMSAFLMEYVGTEFGLEEIKNAGLKKARDIFKLYQSNKTFSEFNSPTYYGVTLIGLGLWRELAFSKEIQEMGKALEMDFWHETTNFYNPNLKNMPGPYFRAYGMDMNKYFAITGTWIALAVDDEKLAPLPPKKGPKYGEMSNLSTIFNVGLSIPKADLAKLKSFSKPQFIARNIPNNYKGDSIKKVTAMMNKDWMMGALWGNKRVWEQIKTGTIHWKTPDGDIAWLMTLGDGKTNVKVSKTQMSIFANDTQPNSFEVFVYAKKLTKEAFTPTKWSLSGMILGINTTLKITQIDSIDDKKLHENYAISDEITGIYKITFEIPAYWDISKPLVEITPKK